MPAVNAPCIGPRLTTLIALSALAVLPVNMFVPSLPHIASTFNADFALVNLSVAGFAVVAALTHLIAGPLSDRYGRRPVVLTAVAIFTLASIGCALAPNIGIFLMFRFMQAVVATGYSVSLAIIKETSGTREAASKIGLVASAWAVAPMIGPTIGGVLDELFGWRASFVVFAILGAAVFVLSAVELRQTVKPPVRTFADYIYGYRDIVRAPLYWAYTLCMAFASGTFYIFLGGAPMTVGSSLAGSTVTLGLLMGVVPAGFMTGSHLASRYSSRFPLSTMVVIGRLLTCAGLLIGLMLSLYGVTHVAAFFGPCVFIGLGNGLTMPGATAGALSIRPDLAGTAAGLTAALTLAGAAVVASSAGVFLSATGNTSQTGATTTLFCVLLVSAILALLAASLAAQLSRNSAQ
jgi:MFS transporter, DHA1 family, multidrug resistance protein